MREYIMVTGDKYGKTIAPTPVLEGEDLKEFIKERKSPINKKEKEISERIKNAKDIVI